MGKVSWATWAYIVAVAAAAAAVLARAPASAGTARWWAMYATLAVLFIVCDSTPTPLAARQSAWSPSSAATLAGVGLLGPVAAAMTGAVSLVSVRRGSVLAERLFNGGMYALAGYAAGEGYLAAGGRTGLPGPAVFPGLIGPFAAAAAVHVIT